MGCTKVSAACDHCYAEAWAKRTGHPELWQGQRRRTTAANWRAPLKWDRAAATAGERHRVFCASLADVFDNQVPAQWREDLWGLIRETPNLDWLLLTKRPQNIAKMLPAQFDEGDRWPERWPHVWLGTTVENQGEADRRIPHLLATPAAVRFLSCEPLLGPINLRPLKLAMRGAGTGAAGIDWIIVGGESGPGARPMHPDWARSLRDQCDAAGVPFFFKQWGEWAPHRPVAGGDLGGDVRAGRVTIVHPTGQSDVEVAAATGGRNTIPGSRYMARLGKKAAGRQIDGREWNELPVAA